MAHKRQKHLERKLQKVVKILPEAQVELDNYGQIVIFTNIVQTESGLHEIDLGKELDEFRTDPEAKENRELYLRP